MSIETIDSPLIFPSGDGQVSVQNSPNSYIRAVDIDTSVLPDDAVRDRAAFTPTEDEGRSDDLVMSLSGFTRGDFRFVSFENESKGGYDFCVGIGTQSTCIS